MTLQERMIACYLRQAELPEGEKAKLKLFLGLLLETFDHDESDEEDRTRFQAKKTGPDNGKSDQKKPVEAKEHPTVSEVIRALDYLGVQEETMLKEADVEATSWWDAKRTGKLHWRRIHAKNGGNENDQI